MPDESNDGSLFREALEAPTLEQFENAAVLPPKPEPELVPPTEEKPESKPDNTGAPPHPDAAVPSGRFREENERRRQAERERDDLRAQLAAWQVQQRQQPQQQPPGPKPDLFDNPQAYVESVVRPYFEAMQQREQQRIEAYSADNAVKAYGRERVSQARETLAQAMTQQDPQAWATYHRAMASHDPYGVITRAHMDGEILSQIGGDFEAYKTRLMDEAAKDPAYQKKVMEAMRNNPQARHVASPAGTRNSVPTIPSLSDIGAAGPDEIGSEPSDADLFRAAVSAKRRK